jgi:hypothetical protein
MSFVCVRTVFGDTNSSRAISGPSSSVPSSRSTSSSRALSRSIGLWWTGPAVPGRVEDCQDSAEVIRGGPLLRSRSQEEGHGGALIHEAPDVALPLSQPQGTFQGCKGSRDEPPRD